MDMGQETFTKKTKMADIVHINYSLLLLINRFGIRLGFGDKTVEEVCNKYNINTELFLLVCNVFHANDYTPSSSAIASFPVDQLVSFLKQSHTYYLQVSIPRIITLTENLLPTCELNTAKALKKFLTIYIDEVKSHLENEEKVVYPHIQQLWEGKRNNLFSVKEFEEKHDDLEEKLADMKNIIIKYIPENSFNEQKNDLLKQLFVFEEDLNRHTCIENKLLLSRGLLLEKEMK
jgi:regulator of cell morphogenesis and NO signaling